MPSLFSPLFLVAVLLLGALVALALVLLSRLGASGRTLPYRRVDSLLSPGEMRFYLTLRQVVGARYLIMAKVRLADLLVITAAGKDWWQAFRPIGSKHVDFVLVNPSTLAPVLVIELDDATHERADRRARDSQVDRILGSAGLPILHVPVRKVYEAAALATEVQQVSQMGA